MMNNSDAMRIANNLDRLERAYGGKIPTGAIDMNALNRDLSPSEIMTMANDLKRIDRFRASGQSEAANIVEGIAIFLLLGLGLLLSECGV